MQPKHACRALAKLQKIDLISATRKGHLVLEIGRPNVATRWRLNFLEEAHPMSSLSCPKRSPNASSGCSAGASSPVQPVRSSVASSLRDALGERSIDNLTRAKPASAADDRLAASRRGDLAGDRQTAPCQAQSNPGKPNGANQTAVAAVVVSLTRGKRSI